MNIPVLPTRPDPAQVVALVILVGASLYCLGWFLCVVPKWCFRLACRNLRSTILTIKHEFNWFEAANCYSYLSEPERNMLKLSVTNKSELLQIADDDSNSGFLRTAARFLANNASPQQSLSDWHDVAQTPPSPIEEQSTA